MSQKAKRKKVVDGGISIAIAEHDLTNSAREFLRFTDNDKDDNAVAKRVVRPPRAYAYERASSLQSLADALRQDTTATGAAIALEVDGQIICVASSGTAPPIGVAIDRATGISGVCLRDAKTIVCDDAESDARVNRASSCYIRSIIAAPVFSHDRASGLVEILSTSAFAFTPLHAAHTEDVARSLQQQYAPAMPAADAMASDATFVQPPVFQTINGSAASFPLGNSTIPERARNVIALIVAHGRTIAITSVVLTVFLTLLWLALKPRAPQPEVAPQQAELATGTETPARDSLQQAPQTSGDDVVSAPTTPRGAKASTRSGHPATPRVEEEAAVLQPAPLANNRAASSSSSSQVEPPPVLALPSQLTSVELSSPQAVLASPAPHRSGGQLIYQVKPTYPAFARTQSLSGNVELLAIVAASGHVSKVQVISGDPVLVVAAVDAVRQWRYTPLLIDGHAVGHQLPVTVVFKARQD